MPQHAGLNATVGDLRRLSVTLPQAAQVLKIDVARVRKAVDTKVVTPTMVMRGERAMRTLDGIDVLGLRIGRVLDRGLSKKVYGKLKGASDADRLETAFGPHPEDQSKLFGYVFDAAAQTLADLQSLRSLAEHVDERGVLKGSRVEAHRIAALAAGGMSVDEIIKDYPDLDRSMVEAAVTYADANPKQGRPYPGVTAKSALGKGGGGGLAAAFAEGRDVGE